MVETLTEDSPVYEQPEESVESTEEESGNGLLYNVGQGVASVYNRLTEVFRRGPRETPESTLGTPGAILLSQPSETEEDNGRYTEFTRTMEFYSNEMERIEDSLSILTLSGMNDSEMAEELKDGLIPSIIEMIGEDLMEYGEYRSDDRYKEVRENIPRLVSMQEEVLRLAA
jgi:hypothetical protein